MNSDIKEALILFAVAIIILVFLLTPLKYFALLLFEVMLYLLSFGFFVMGIATIVSYFKHQKKKQC